MIYLNNTTKEQEIFIPKTIDREVWKVSLQIKSTISSDNFSIDGVVGNCSALYYSMMVVLSEKIVSGEYEYTLSDEVGVLSTGLLVIGDLELSTEYNNEIAYEQYTE
jgi:hypothetical protein